MRVCPECGEPAGERPFCESCGRNLMRVERLPSREEWEARQKYERKRGLDHDDGPRPAASHPRLVRIARLAAVPVAAVVVVVAVALIAGKSASVSGVTASVRVPSPSMVPTLPLGSTVRVLVSQSYVPKVGDIVVFHPPKGADPATPVCGAPNQGGGHAARVRQTYPGRVRRDVHKADRRRARRHDHDQRRPRDPQRVTGAGLVIHRAVRLGSVLQLPHADHDPTK